MSGDVATSSASWVLLTTGSRPQELDAAIGSIRRATNDDVAITVVANGVPAPCLPGVSVIESEENLGIPGGRDLAMRAVESDIVFFLDDDALVIDDWPNRVVALFDADPTLGVVSMRLSDEQGETARRHSPRVGRRGLSRAGRVPTFLGGACAIRRGAYLKAGGYWPELFYGHEELDLAWRLTDLGWAVWFDPHASVFHPRTPISRHQQGWWYTGRNRVMIARRNLTWPIALAHVGFWLVVGAVRAPAGTCRRSYLEGWRAGWREPVDRSPIGWRSVWTLTRIGRPPII